MIDNQEAQDVGLSRWTVTSCVTKDKSLLLGLLLPFLCSERGSTRTWFS